eukprot:13042794-Ditylum_brightwellii.AAC.1
MYNMGEGTGIFGHGAQFLEKEKVKISIINFVKYKIKQLQDTIEGMVSSPAAHHLFNVNIKNEKIPDDMVRSFTQPQLSYFVYTRDCVKICKQ